MRRRRAGAGAVLAAVPLVLALAFVAAGCGGDAAAVGRSGKEIKPLEASALPAELLGLRVTPEDTSAYLAEVDRTYLDRFGLFGLRKGDVLEASLQVSRFGEDAEYRSASFRGRLLNQIGAAKAETFRMGETTVYLTTGTKQQIGVWFRDRHMFVLSVRDDFRQPRALLRAALEIRP